jgi:hypothetical protein
MQQTVYRHLGDPKHPGNLRHGQELLAWRELTANRVRPSSGRFMRGDTKQWIVVIHLDLPL